MKEIDELAEKLGLKRNKGETDENLHWRYGYAQGMKEAVRVNSHALSIGQAILNACDERYEFKKEDY